MYWKRWSYKLVGKDAGDIEDKAGSPDGSHQPARTPMLPRFLRPAAEASPHAWWATASSVAAAILLGLYIFTPRPWLASDRPARVHHVGCGSTPSEAEAAGCKFDVMSYTWVQPACFDQELMYDFLGHKDWSWYADEETPDALTVTDVAHGQHEFVYVTWDYYTTHCAYMWKKMHRSLMTSRELDSYVFDYRHTEQCEMVLLDRDHQMDSRSVMLVAKYPSCPIAV